MRFLVHAAIFSLTFSQPGIPTAPATEIWSEDLGTLKATLKTGRGGSHTGDSFALFAGAIGDGLPPLSHIRDYKQFVEGFFARA